ncbi:MAG: DUF5979 domain-containing protein, partial [Clostridiales Family XIII bacterium]|nr:DUF5979 domain-containing protein [Clostridiales Family XIII bacterium]
GTLTADTTVTVENTARTDLTLTVEKDVASYAVGDDKDTEFTFTVTINGTPQSITLKDATSRTFDNLTYGSTYTVTENAPGYTTTGEVTKEVPLIRNEDVTVVNTTQSYPLIINYLYADGTPAAPQYSNSFTFKDSYQIPSHTIAGYTPSIPIVTGVIPTNTVTVNVIYSASTGTAYTVQHFLVSAGGTVTLDGIDNLAGTTNAIVNAIPRTYASYTLNRSYAGTVATGTIAPDGSTVLSLYYVANPVVVPPFVPPAAIPPFVPAPDVVPPVVVAPVNTPLTSGAVAEAPDNSTKINDGKVAKDSGGHWALLNLLLTLLTALLMILILLTYALRKKDHEEYEAKKKGIIRLSSIAVTIVAVVVFVLTEDMTLPMKWLDEYTIWMALIAVVQIGVTALSKKKYEEKYKEVKQS